MIPQAPQLSRLVRVLTHLLLQLVCPLGQASRHLPMTQTWPAVQLVPQVPQLLASDWVLTQAPLQLDWPEGQLTTHLPAVQILPAPHLVPQAPQCMASDLVLTQAPLQLVWVPGQTSPALQAWSQPPQCLELLLTSVQRPPQILLGAAQGATEASHFPALQALSLAQALPQVPQWALLFWASMQTPPHSV